jgi:hypothetical protein
MPIRAFVAGLEEDHIYRRREPHVRLALGARVGSMGASSRGRALAAGSRIRDGDGCARERALP